MYGVAFVVEEVALLLKREDFCAAEEVGKDKAPKGERKQEGQEREQGQDQGGKFAIPPLTCEDLNIWLTARLGSITGQVMSSCKVSGLVRMQYSLQMHSSSSLVTS